MDQPLPPIDYATPPRRTTPRWQGAALAVLTIVFIGAILYAKRSLSRPVPAPRAVSAVVPPMPVTLPQDPFQVTVPNSNYNIYLPPGGRTPTIYVGRFTPAEANLHVYLPGNVNSTATAPVQVGRPVQFGHGGQTIYMTMISAQPDNTDLVLEFSLSGPATTHQATP
jgi:hypothetical protein